MKVTKRTRNSYPHADLFGDGKVLLYTSVIPIDGSLRGFSAGPVNGDMHRAFICLGASEAAECWPKRFRVIKNRYTTPTDPSIFQNFLSVCSGSSFECTDFSGWLIIANENDLMMLKMILDV